MGGWKKGGTQHAYTHARLLNKNSHSGERLVARPPPLFPAPAMSVPRRAVGGVPPEQRVEGLEALREALEPRLPQGPRPHAAARVHVHRARGGTRWRPAVMLGKVVVLPSKGIVPNNMGNILHSTLPAFFLNVRHL